METTLHLVAMPWSNPHAPSPQLAALAAYVDTVLRDRVVTQTHSAFVHILLEQRGGRLIDYHDSYVTCGDYVSFLHCHRAWLHREPGLGKVSASKVIADLNASADIKRPLTLRALHTLEKRTLRYIDDVLVPTLRKDALNVIGLTLTFAQVYSSAYLVHRLTTAHPEIPCLFVFGGELLGLARVASLLRRAGVRGIGVVGEGEKKLERILELCLATPEENRDSLVARAVREVPGTYDLGDETADPRDHEPQKVGGQIERMTSLPLPEFDEYFAALKKAIPQAPARSSFKEQGFLPLEGSRGCFAKCDFCNVPRLWEGYRAATGDWVAERTLAAVHRARGSVVWFTDNVCDSWAARYAEVLIERGVRVRAFMEMRAHHPQMFWTRLALAGVDSIQVGVEAIAPPLLKAMRKGTTVRQNILAQKWLKELGIKSYSNLITHHPRSTVEDVRVTKQTLLQIPHLDRLDLSPFGLVPGSGLELALDDTERAQLREWHPIAMSGALRGWMVGSGAFVVPNGLKDKTVTRAWDRFTQWEEGWAARHGGTATITQARFGEDALRIQDDRFGSSEEHWLEGDVAAGYDACHAGADVRSIARATKLEPAALDEALSTLRERQLVLEIEGWFVALALRPRDELVRQYFTERPAVKRRLPCLQSGEAPNALAVV